MSEEKKPSGGKAMDDLMGKLIQVPKKALDRMEQRYRKAKAKRKKK